MTDLTSSGVKGVKPPVVNIMGIEYTITYVDNPSDVDIFKRETCFGQIDYWTRTIRVYDNNRNLNDIWVTIFHEVIHGIVDELNLKVSSEEKNHDDLGILALALADTLFRNDWMKPE